MEPEYPRDFLAGGWNIGLKPELPDFAAVFSKQPCQAAAVFTRNSFPGHPVVVGREHIKNGQLQALIINSANANVATGPRGLELARKCCQEAASSLGIAAEDVLPSSTGVIARALPESPMLEACRSLKARLQGQDFNAFAEAIRTTDAYPKKRHLELVSGIHLTAIAKGAGMIQPNMATMLAYFLSDARISAADLKRLLDVVVNKSFNRLSIDSDTSTSDTVVIMSNGASGVAVEFPEQAAQKLDAMVWPISENDLQTLELDDVSLEFVQAVLEVAISLTRLIAHDGEGATKLIELQIREAADAKQALQLGRSIINSPLVKTAVYGADPNWGRLLMAIGKTFDERLQLDKVRIFFGKFELKGEDQSKKELRILSNYLKNSEVVIRIYMGLGDVGETFWGCDLTEDYVQLNSKYTT